MSGEALSAALRSEDPRPHALAFFLPQFHAIPENDRWWGRGFTDWRNVDAARPQFRGHYQPHVPVGLGRYDLLDADVREAQAALARSHGITGFAWYHYWFQGRRLLERPFEGLLRQRRPSFPFCLCWANENWTRRWDGRERDLLMGQTYSAEDDLQHVRWLLDVFEDERYLRVDGRPLFLVYRARGLPDARRTTDLWREEASRRGFPGLCLCRVESFPEEHDDPAVLGFDAAVEFQPDWTALKGLARSLRYLSARLRRGHRVYRYRDVVDRMLAKPRPAHVRFPCVTPCWDNTARRRRNAAIFDGSSPEHYGRWLRGALERARSLEGVPPIVFLNAWNEWAEGNHLEPDRRFGAGFLEATRAALNAT
jgi:lipopolysaccharide biosynthesis protein